MHTLCAGQRVKTFPPFPLPMSRYLETFLVAHRRLVRLPEHRLRLARTLRCAPDSPTVSRFLALAAHEALVAPDVPRLRGRLVYDLRGEASFSLVPYTPRRIETLRLVHDDHIDYAQKRTDRSALDACFARRCGADDVIIVRRGLLTDTTVANLALFDPHTARWYTPAAPLLAGTHRPTPVSLPPPWCTSRACACSMPSSAGASANCPSKPSCPEPPRAPRPICRDTKRSTKKKHPLCRVTTHDRGDACVGALGSGRTQNARKRAASAQSLPHHVERQGRSQQSTDKIGEKGPQFESPCGGQDGNHPAQGGILLAFALSHGSLLLNALRASRRAVRSPFYTRR